MPRPAPAPRLIDLHVDWLLQYATEATVFDPAAYADTTSRLGQAEGYLGATSAAIVSCYRRAQDWAAQADPWAALGELIARYEAEFPGRLLLGPDDLARWHADPDGLTYGLLGVEGFDPLIRGPSDLDRLGDLFARGVRLFQMAYTADGALAGSSAAGDDRGLTELGRAFLRALAGVVAGAGGPGALVDLAHLNPSAAADVLAWFEAEAPRDLLLISSHGAPRSPACDGPRFLAPDALVRLRALGGTIGLTPAFFPDAEAFGAAIESVAAVPFAGRAGFEGIGLGTDFLGVDRNPAGLGSAPELVAWVAGRFAPGDAEALLRGNGAALLGRLLGGPGG